MNLKRPFNFWPNWEADVERERVPLTGKVGLLEREVDVVIVAGALAQHSLRVRKGGGCCAAEEMPTGRTSRCVWA